MRIVSWNVNGIRAAARKGLREKIAQFDADIIGFQETKANPTQVSEATKDIEGYHVFASAPIRPGYSGVAVFTKEAPENVETHFGIERFDNEGRVVIAHYKNFILVNTYFPNGAGKNGDNSRVPYKLEFYDALFEYIARYESPKFIMGDFNVAHTEIDLARPKQNQNTSGFLPVEREHFSKILNLGYTDTFRHLYPTAVEYSWWNMRFRSREKNIGWRIDGVLACEKALPNVHNAFIWQHVDGSDHCPVGVDLK